MTPTETLMGTLIALLIVIVLTLWIRGSTPGHLLCVTVFGCYLLGVVTVAFLPLPETRLVEVTGWPATRVNLDLVAPWETWSYDPKIFQNILMTVPFGFLLPLVTGWGAGRMMCAIVSFTLFIETLQLTISTALHTFYRAFDVNDLVDNTMGGVIGLLCYALVAAASRPAHYLGEWPDQDDSTVSTSSITWGEASDRHWENSVRK